MFIEPFNPHGKLGWIEVICGSMFSGKTEELIRRLKRAKIANLRVEIFKPTTDMRYSDEDIVSHDENNIPSLPVPSATNIILLSHEAQVIGIDEAQFFDEELPHVCKTLAQQGKRIIIAGLDMDSFGKPFGSMPQLLAIADFVTKLHAICQVCGNIATFSYRKVSINRQVLLGEKDIYEPRCRICFEQEDGF